MSSPDEQAVPEGEPKPEESPLEGEPEAEQGEIAQPPKKKRAMPPSRIAFLVFVLIAMVAIIFELRARWARDGTYDAIDEASTEAENEGAGLYARDLEKLLKGSFSREKNEGTNTEIFTWRGLKAHRIEVQYRAGGFVASCRKYSGSLPE